MRKAVKLVVVLVVYFLGLIKGSLLSAFGIGNANDVHVRVLTFHHVPEDEMEALRALLHYLSQSWQFISPDEFERFMNNEMSLKKSSLLVTFDDGFKSNLRVASEILDPLGIKAIFFVISKFVAMNELDAWRDFVVSRINLSGDTTQLRIDQCNMNISDLQRLQESGHVIGAHTATHARVGALIGDDLRQEIVGSGDELATMLGTPVRHFAYPFGNFESLSELGARMASERYHFVYTGMRGKNNTCTLNSNIMRDANNPNDNFLETQTFLTGKFDWMYSKKLEKHATWVNGNNGRPFE